MNISQQIESLRGLTVGQLKKKYVEIFGEECRTFHKEFLWKRIAWRMQVLAEGDISEHVRRRAMELACDADIRIQAPKGFLPPITRKPDPARTIVQTFEPTGDLRIPMGGELRRTFRGREIVVMVQENGFMFEDKHYKSLSAVAKAATGTNWNGFDFFGIAKKGGKKKGTGQ
jgi:hypothetical protein